MKLETFFEKFDLFADTPDAVAKMRELILGLAVQGQLDQDQRSDATSWPRKALKSLTTKIGSGATPQGGRNSYCETGIPLIRSMNVYIRRFVPEGLAFLSDEQASKLNNVIVEPDDVLLNITGASIGRVAIAPAFMAGARVNQHVAIIRTTKDLQPRFLETVLASPQFQSLIDGVQVGATREALTKRMIEDFEIPLPSIPEQDRIVAKVDALTALCERLDAQQKQREERRLALSRAAIARFDEAPTPASLSLLFHGSYSIAPTDLRRTILNLAVQGKLVPQDAEEEPAGAALERLGLQCANDLEISEDAEIPESWCRVRFEDVAVIAGGVTLGRKLGNRKTVPLPYLRVANVKRGEIHVGDVKEVAIAEDEVDRYALAKGDLLLTEGGDWDKVGRAAIWDGRISPCLHQNHIFRARMRSPEIAPHWFERYFNSPRGRAYFESASKQTTNLASINMRQVRACPIPFPPIAEQNRIILKLDQLMALLDQLELQLDRSAATATKLLDAIVYELLNPSAEVIEFPAIIKDCGSDRAAIGCYAIQRLQENRSFGHTMNMKVIYLAQAHIGLKLDLQFERRAAGPWHPWIEEFDTMGQREGWFTVSEKPIGNGRTKYDYEPKAALKQKAAEAATVLGEHKAEFDRLLGLFADLDTEKAEIVATLFAAWNDFLIDGKSPSDDEIIHEVRENWHMSKQRFSPTKLTDWFKWMRKHRLVPQGREPRTQQQLTLALS